MTLSEIKNSMITQRLAAHPFFTAHTDSKTGITSHVLTEDIAPVIRSLYFQTPSIRGNNEILWCFVAHPPSKALTLTSISLKPEQPELHIHHAFQRTGNPLIHEDGDSVYLTCEDGIYRVWHDGRYEEIFRYPASLIANRRIYRMVTSLTQSSDGKYFLLDSQIGNRWIVGLVECETGEYHKVHEFAWDHHHAVFSLHDPNLFLINHANGHDPHTGDKYNFNIRTWVMDIHGTRYEPMDPTLWFNHNAMGCHEWWVPGQNKIQWCDYETGVWEIDLDSKEKQVIWDRQLIHGQVSGCGRYLVGDYNPYTWSKEKPCSVYFYDRQQEQEVTLAHELPPVPDDIPRRDRRAYHLDPHPNFSADGQLIIHSSTHLGKQSLSLIDTPQVINKLND